MLGQLEGNIMWKAIAAGTVALTIAGGSFAVAQHRPGRDGGYQRWQPSAEDLRALGEARLAALRAGLALTSEQERNWAAFEQAARDYGKLRMERRSAMRNAAAAGRSGRAPAAARRSPVGHRCGIEKAGGRHRSALQEPGR